MKNNEIKTGQFIDLQRYYFMFNPVSVGVNMLANLLAEQQRLAEQHL